MYFPRVTLITIVSPLGGNVSAKSTKYCLTDTKHDSIFKARHIHEWHIFKKANSGVLSDSRKSKYHSLCTLSN